MDKKLIAERRLQNELKASGMSKDIKVCFLRQEQKLNRIISETINLMATSMIPGFYSAKDELEANAMALKANLELVDKLYQFDGLRRGQLFDKILEDNNRIIQRVSSFKVALEDFIRQNIVTSGASCGEDLETLTALINDGDVGSKSGAEDEE